MVRTTGSSTAEAWSGVERRKLPRVTLRRPVSVRLLSTGGAEYFGLCENASADGMLLLVGEKIAETSQIEVMLILPAAEGKVQIEMRCSGRVVRIAPGTQDWRWGIAVEFFDRSISWEKTTRSPD